MKAFRRLPGYLVAIAFIVVPVFLFSQRQAIADWWELRDYTPPASVVKLAGDDQMTDYARHVFYVNHPELIGKASAFRKDCASKEHTIVLGCYHGNQQGIYIYDVQDSRLAGVEQVTAAHEMLHAAYDRLSQDEKDNVNKMLTDFYKTNIKDQRLIDTINTYKKTEPNDVVNEMHSIFGTEVSSLTPDLETYYQKYFSNRSVVVGFAQNYKGEFTRRTDQINADDAQLAKLKVEIDAAETSLELQLYDLQASRVKLDSLLSTGQIAAHNAAVDPYNAKVIAYNNNVASLKAKIKRYNDLVEARNALAVELRDLNNALNTNLTTQPAQ